MLSKILSVFKKKESQEEEEVREPFFDTASEMYGTQGFVDAFKTKNYAELELLFAQANHDLRSNYLETVCRDLSLTQEIYQWNDAKQTGLSLLVKGYHHVFLAWNARSSAWNISQEQADKFHELLLEAKRLLEEAIELIPNEAEPWVAMIVVCMGLGLDKEDAAYCFNKAIEFAPLHFDAYWHYVDYLNPKWYGSIDEMFEFARSVKEKNDPRLLQVLLYTYAECYMSLYRDGNKEFGEMFYTRPEAVAEIKEMYAKTRALKATPQLPLTSFRNYMSFNLYLIDMDKEAKEELALADNKVTIYPWYILSAKSPQDVYKRLKI